MYRLGEAIFSQTQARIALLQGAVLQDNARGNNFAVVRVVWVKHRTFNGRFYKGNVASKYPLDHRIQKTSNTECSFLM